MSILKKYASYTFQPATPGQVAVVGAPARAAYTQYVNEPIYRSSQRNIIIQTNNGPVSFPSGAIKIVAGYTTRAIFHPATAAVAAVPGIPFTLASFARVANLGWSGGARSIASLPAAGQFNFTVPATVTGVVTGLTENVVGPAYEAIDYGFYLTHGRALIYEAGITKAGPFAYTDTTAFSVRRTSAVIEYLMNGVVVYRSTRTSVQPLVADASLYAPSDNVSSAALVPSTAAGGFGQAVMEPIDAAGQAGVRNMGRSRLRPITGNASGRRLQGVHARLRPVSALGSDYNYSAGSSALDPLTSQGSAGKLEPTYAIAITSLGFIQSASHGLTGGVGNSAGRMLALIGLAADHAYGVSTASLAPIEAVGYRFPPIQGYALLQLPRRARLTASGTAGEPNSFHGTVTGTLRAFGGATAVLTPRAPRLLATGVGTNLGRAHLEAPAPVLRASGKTGGVGRAHMTLDVQPTVRGFTGAVLRAVIGNVVHLVAAGVTGSVGRARMRLPLYVLTASGSQPAYGEARLLGPHLVPVSSGAALLSARYELHAAGHAVVAYDSEAYAMQMILAVPTPADPTPVHALSRYTSYPFTQIVRFGSRYYGVAADGLYLLDGETDAGVPISWDMQTGFDDLKSKQLKRMLALYINGRLDTSVVVNVVVGEQEEDVYSYQTERGENIQNYRVKSGKGLRSRYYGVGISDPMGKHGEVDGLDLQIEILKRAI